VEIFLKCLHVLAAVFMVVVVLLQQGKGADIGSAFGAGASQTVFGSRGAGNFLTKLTAFFVCVFMGTSMWLTYFTSSGSSVLRNLDDGTAPATAPAPEAQPIPEPGPAQGNSDTPSGFEVVPPTGDGQGAGAATPPASGEAKPAAQSEAPAPEGAAKGDEKSPKKQPKR
jgi:preprotein translocase subunit SecG